MHTKMIGTLGKVALKLIAVGPADAPVELSIACMFQHELRGNLTGGLLRLDQALDGALWRLRREGFFHGHALETLLLTKVPATVHAQALLIVGLGDPKAFTADVLQDAVLAAAQQALRMDVETVAFSPNLLDAGFASDELSGIQSALLYGLHSAQQREECLFDRGFRSATKLQSWSFEAGEEHFDEAALSFEAPFRKLKRGLKE